MVVRKKDGEGAGKLGKILARTAGQKGEIMRGHKKGDRHIRDTFPK